jgi:hypothetical protein
MLQQSNTRKAVALMACIFCLGFTSVNAQKKKEIIREGNTLGFSILPSAQGRFLKIKDAPDVLKDSLRKADQLKTSLGFGLSYRFLTGRDWYVTTGVYYNNMGFTRVKDKVSFLDTIHRMMPEGQKVIADDLQFETQVNYHYNYKYLEFPVFFGKDITPRNMKRGEVKIAWFAGGVLAGLIGHSIDIDFVGFTPYGLKTITIKETELLPLVVNFSAIVGARVDVDMYPKVKMFFQPQLQKNFLYSSYGIERHHLYTLRGEIGISYRLDKEKKKT